MLKYSLFLLSLLGFSILMQFSAFSQGVGINETGQIPNAKAILDVASTSKGMLIPRMTTEQRNAIESPPQGLQIYNLTTNTMDIFRGGTWEAVAFAEGANVVKVSALTDLPAPQGDAIILEPRKIYVVSGIVDISPYYINLNGSGLKGNLQQYDGIASNVSGAVLRSTDMNVHVKSLHIRTLSGATKAYNFSGGTELRRCVIQESLVSQSVVGSSVGDITGFTSIYLSENFWTCSDGIKVGGTVGELNASNNIIDGITSGSGFEFLAGLKIEFIALTSNSFIYSGGTGVKLNTGVTFNVGRLTLNYFKSTVSDPLSGFTSYTPGWEMTRNARIPDTRSFGILYMSDNNTATATTASNFVKVAGTTTDVQLDKFTATGSNRLTYIGKRALSTSVFVAISGTSPANATDITIAIAKNGVIIPNPSMTIRGISNNVSFHLSMESEVDLINNDYIEVFVRTGASALNLIVKDMQFRVRN